MRKRMGRSRIRTHFCSLCRCVFFVGILCSLILVGLVVENCGWCVEAKETGKVLAIGTQKSQESEWVNVEPQKSIEPEWMLAMEPQKSIEPEWMLAMEPQETKEPEVMLAMGPHEMMEPEWMLAMGPQKSIEPEVMLAMGPQKSIEPEVMLAMGPHEMMEPEEMLSYEYWGKQLTVEERRIYDLMVSGCCSKTRKTIQISFEKKDIWEDGEEGIEAYVSNLVARAYSAFTYDYPLYRPASYTYRYSVEGLEVTVSIFFTEFYEDFFEDLEQVEADIVSLERKILEEYENRMNLMEQNVDTDSEDKPENEEEDEIEESSLVEKEEGMEEQPENEEEDEIEESSLVEKEERMEEQPENEEEDEIEESSLVEKKEGMEEQPENEEEDEINSYKTIEVELSEEKDIETYLKLELIYESVIKQITYSLDTDSVSLEQADLDPVVFSVSGAVLDRWNHHAVCSGYSGLFQILCNDLGIPCIQVCNDGTNERTAHSYNYVYLSDGWYLVDCTWGDEEGSVNWDSFLAGGKVSLDGRRVGNQLANQYVEDQFENPELVDTFYFQFDQCRLKEPEIEKVVYDLCDENCPNVNEVDVDVRPYSDSLMDKMMIDNSDESCIILSDRYWKEQLTKEYENIIYPQYVYEDNVLHITGYQDIMKLNRIPQIIAMEYCFDYVGSDIMFYMSQNNYDSVCNQYDFFSMKVETNSEILNSNITDEFLQNEKKRKQSDRLFGISVSNWSDFYRDGNMMMEIPLDSDLYVDSNVIYAYGIDTNGHFVDIGKCEITNKRDIESSMEEEDSKQSTQTIQYVHVKASCGTILFYQKEWRTDSGNRRIFIIILVVFIVLAATGMLVYKYKK